jgi:hypothetical protein
MPETQTSPHVIHVITHQEMCELEASNVAGLLEIFSTVVHNLYM